MNTLARGIEIAWRSGCFVLAWLWWHKRDPQRLPERLRSTVERLGATFVKLAQALSLRIDVLPTPYRDALGTLQQHAAPFAPELAIEAIEQGFGKPLCAVFATFDATPLAAASIAQIHRAELHDGTRVVVKVRRPDIVAQVRRDVRLLRAIVAVAAWLVPALHRQRPLALVDELSSQLSQELDLRLEARNVRRLAAAARDRPDVFIPAICEPWVCEAALVQQFCPGRPVAAEFGTDEGRRLAGVLVDVYLHQVFAVGVFHADPHPGNVFVLDDGRLCLLDFGLVGTLDAGSRRALAALLEAIVYRDATAALDAAIDLGFIGGAVDRREQQRGIDAILAEMAGLPLSEWSLPDAIWRIAQVGNGENFRIPRHLLVLLRALFLLESTTRALSPGFDLVDELLHRRRTLTPEAAGTGPARPPGQSALRAMREVPRIVGEWLHQARLDEGRPAIAIHHRGLLEMEATLARTGNRLVLALLALGLYVGGAVLMQQSAGPRVLGDLPLSAVVAFAMACYLTVRLAWAIIRSGRL